MQMGRTSSVVLGPRRKGLVLGHGTGGGLLVSLSQSQIPLIGVNLRRNRGGSDLNPTTPAQNAAMLTQLGAKIARQDVFWADVEYVASSYDWSAYTPIYSALTGAGVTPIFIASKGTAVWTGDFNTPPTTAPARAAYAAFCAAMAVQFPLAIIEIFNEPNNSQQWGIVPEPVNYGQLLNGAATAIKAASPSTIVVSAGLAIGGPDFIDPVTFMTAYLPYVDTSKVDMFGQHPYQGGDSYPGDIPSLMENTRSRMQALMPVGSSLSPRNTEQGVSAFECTGADITAKRIRQGSFAARFVLAALTLRHGAIWYNMVDDGVDAGEIEQNYGLFDFDFAIKPSGDQFQNIISLINACSQVTIRQTSTGYRAAFAIAGEGVVNIDWTSAGVFSVPSWVKTGASIDSAYTLNRTYGGALAALLTGAPARTSTGLTGGDYAAQGALATLLNGTAYTIVCEMGSIAADDNISGPYGFYCYEATGVSTSYGIQMDDSTGFTGVTSAINAAAPHKVALSFDGTTYRLGLTGAAVVSVSNTKKISRTKFASVNGSAFGRPAAFRRFTVLPAGSSAVELAALVA